MLAQRLHQYLDAVALWLYDVWREAAGQERQ